MDSQKYSLTQNNFVAQLDNIKLFHSVLKAINFKESATFRAMSEGLKVTVEDSKCVQCSAYIPSNSFTHYRVAQDADVKFMMPLSVLVECLNMFSSGEYCSMKMYYRGPGSPLTVVLEPNTEDDMIMDCTIKTQEPEELLDFSMPEHSIVNNVIVHGAALVTILGDADRTTEVMELLLSPNAPHIRITTIGNQGESQVDIPRSSDMVDTFNCTTVTKTRYRWLHIKFITRAMGLANKVSIRTDDCGLLSLQIMIVSDNIHMYIEYFITPLIEEN